jgi:hypothetical protein
MGHPAFVAGFGSRVVLIAGLCGISRGPRFALTGGFFLLTLGGRDSLM